MKHVYCSLGTTKRCFIGNCHSTLLNLAILFYCNSQKMLSRNQTPIEPCNQMIFRNQVLHPIEPCNLFCGNSHLLLLKKIITPPYWTMQLNSIVTPTRCFQGIKHSVLLNHAIVFYCNSHMMLSMNQTLCPIEPCKYILL